MASVAGSSTVATQPAPPALDDVRRAREFYHYLQPDNLVHPDLPRRSSVVEISDQHVPSLSNVLAPFCQLATLRCNARKAMINVMDRDIMYFLAEATKISAGDSEEVYEFVEDPILMRCSTAPLKGRICELTIALDNTDDTASTPMFVIRDLTSSQFAQMEIVTGPPHYRFYAGVPITTHDGVNIGSLAVMDTRPRPDGLTVAEEKFLAATAAQLMLYLDTNRQAIEGRRSRRMAGGLEAFIGGKKTMQKVAHSSENPFRKRSKATYGVGLPSENNAAYSPTQPEHRLEPSRTNTLGSVEGGGSTSGETTESDEPWAKTETDVESRSHSKTFTRAANLLRECMGDLGEDGCVAFFSLTTQTDNNRRRRLSKPLARPRTSTSPIEMEDATAASNSQASSGQAPVIAFSTQEAPFNAEKSVEDRTQAIDDKMLRSLIKRYPGGRLWSLDVNTASSSEDDKDLRGASATGISSSNRPRRSRRKQMEREALRAAFPAAGQVLFAPLWDATIGTFTHGCFVATSLDIRSFGPNVELPFLNSFCSTLMAECSRLDTMAADKQKSDFVGTISHEMRSPLHGLLASVEFLSETDLTGFQKSLIDTVDSCGRTLLDTINHVLDFSKVNSFQKLWQSSNKKSHGARRNNFLGPENSSKSLAIGAPPLLQLFGVTDVSTILEEVVDGLVLGHTYNSGIDITDVSRNARGRGNTNQRGEPLSDPVDIVLDVQQEDWVFLTQPGAIRRIIMNITGNAIKYTSQGTINVRLRLQKLQGEETNEVMALTVADTGKGISQEFLSSRLFVPFAQENALAPGTGLGLSIVRSIVLMLGGTIDVKSKVNQGTTVEVVLPLKRPLPGQTSTHSTPWSGTTVSSTSSSGEESISVLKYQFSDTTVAFYRHEVQRDGQLADVIKSYVQDWYNLQFLDQALCHRSDVIVVKEADLDYVIDQMAGTPGRRPALVVLCSVSSKHSVVHLRSLEERISSVVEFVSTPSGPHKLARSIRLALEKKQSLGPASSTGPIAIAGHQGVDLAHSSTSHATLESVSEELHEMDLNAPGETDKAKIVHATETFAASQASENAQMAIHEPIVALRSPRSHVSEGEAFPFPVQSQESSRLRVERSRSKSVTLKVPSDTTTPLSTTPKAGAPAPAEPRENVDKVNPHVLLVEDNIINLKLLETYLRTKRKYGKVESAQDGEQAVNAVSTAEEPFDIIFMDISMPIMNGFEATRAIRQFESGRQADPGAMIIALTGLASGKDQTEVFDSGCDIYMTKPVSFKEVGKLLNHWEAHQNNKLAED